MVLEYHFCLISPFMEENIARIRGSGQKWAIAIGKMMNSQPSQPLDFWTSIYNFSWLTWKILKFCSPRCPQHFPVLTLWVLHRSRWIGIYRFLALPGGRRARIGCASSRVCRKEGRSGRSHTCTPPCCGKSPCVRWPTTCPMAMQKEIAQVHI